jgi:two-component system NtrC family sensor kinase
MSWLIREVDRRLRGRAIESEVVLTIDLDAEIPNVVGDPVLLRQVILNVISNAIQAAERLPLGEPREVTIRSWFDGERVRVSISDTGPGIDAEHLARVFEPFFTTKTVGQGIGLGLAVAYAIVQQHSGAIWVESNPTRGTVFHIALPILQEENDRENTPSRDKGIG